MKHFIRQHLIELQPTAQTIRNNVFRVQLFYFLHQAVAQLNRCLMKLAFESHNARHTAAVQIAFDRLEVNSGNLLQKVQIGSADVLFSQVAGRKVDHAARNPAGCYLYFAGLMEISQIASQIIGVFRHQNAF